MSIIIAILILNLLIAIHELGHFLAAKACKVGVDEFSLGMGPKIVSKEYKGTVYSIRWILVGGYVRLNEEEFENARLLKKLIIIASGVIFNFIFAVLGIWVYLLAYSPSILTNLFRCFIMAIELTFAMIAAIIGILFEMFRTTDTSGFMSPVGVVSEISNFVESGFLQSLEMFAVLNLNLFVFNLIPIPALDGGQMIFMTIKRIFKNKDLTWFENAWTIVGVCIIGLIFIVAFKNDIVRFLF